MDAQRQAPALTYRIRQAASEDIPKLGAIERSAGQLFRAVGLGAVADDEPMPAEVLTSYLDQANLWVANPTHVGKAEPVAFLAVFPLTKAGTTRSHDEKFLHIAELSVHADHQRRGLAKTLVSTLEEKARQQGVAGLSLTTYRDLAFNGPFYAKIGFEELQVDGIEGVVGRRGKELWNEEQDTMKDKGAERRCWMIKMLNYD